MIELKSFATTLSNRCLHKMFYNVIKFFDDFSFQENPLYKTSNTFTASFALTDVMNIINFLFIL